MWHKLNILGFQWLAQAQEYNYLVDYRRTVRRRKPYEEWLNIAREFFIWNAQSKID